jgi:putative endonuclease
MAYWVYILANRRNGTLYVGVTRDLPRRIYQHREELLPSFTSRYGVKMLVYAEPHDTMMAAVQREKNIKHWPRRWKINVIESANPEWNDLFEDIL